MININVSQRAFIGLTILLGFLVFSMFIHSFVQWHADWLLSHEAPPAQTPITSNNKTAEAIAALPQAHLFGEHASLGTLGDMPITSLQLHITGIIKIENEQKGSVSKALISIAGQPSKAYQVGDRLPVGVKVYAITPDAVVLENNHRLEKLPLSRQRLNFQPENKAHTLILPSSP